MAVLSPILTIVNILITASINRDITSGRSQLSTISASAKLRAPLNALNIYFCLKQLVTEELACRATNP